jgi:hypothetical protein
MTNPPEPNDPVEFDNLPDDDKPKRGVPEDGYRWHEVWSMVLASPGEETFQRILTDPRVSVGRALVWLVLGAVVSVGVTLLPIISSMPRPSFILIAWGIMTLVLVLALFIYSSVLQMAARLLGGAGTHREFVYSYAAFSAPLYVIRALVGLLAVSPIFAYGIMIYDILLTAMALRTVNRFGWLRAVVTMVLGQFVLLLVVSQLLNALLELLLRSA